jgi:hypothetical protein
LWCIIKKRRKEMEKKKHDSHSIREVKTYVDTDGREVIEFIPLFGKEKEAPFLKGRFTIQVGAMAPNGVPMGRQNVRLEFPFDEGVGVKKAFEDFDELAQKEVETWKKEQDERMKASKIIGAHAMPSALVGADGRPMPLKAK